MVRVAVHLKDLHSTTTIALAGYRTRTKIEKLTRARYLYAGSMTQ